MQYWFRGLEPTDFVVGEDKPTEGFLFGDFDSRDSDWWLVSRDAPTPEENVITETVPYMQGVYDFSMFQGERFFGNRDITYKVFYSGSVYRDRKGFEQDIKRQLMPFGEQTLTDTHEEVYYWRGKCKSVEVEDTAGGMMATIVFDCYPFAFTSHNEGADYWDDVYFPHWVWQETKYKVSADQSITLYNLGSRPVPTSFEVTGKVTIKGKFGTVELTADNYAKTEIVLAMRANKISLSGSGTILFKFTREEML